MQGWLRRNRAEVERSLRTVEGREYFSPALLAQYRVLVPLLLAHAAGRVIDLGAGDAPFREYLPDVVTLYHTLEMQPRSEDVTYVGDVQAMPIVPAESYDTAVCLETLEHVPEPWRAVGEIYRILAPGGKVILSVPHLSRLHDAPHDYYRYTAYGVRHLLESNGFTVLALERKGGLFSFLGHQASNVFLSAVWGIKGLRRATWFLNKWLITLPGAALDDVFSRGDVFALGFVAVGQKPADEAAQGTAG